MTERQPANAPLPHFSAYLNLCFFPSFFNLFFLYLPCSLLSFLTPSPALLLSLFSLFQFSWSLSSLLLCSFQPFLVHLSSATCPRLSSLPLLFFSPLFVLCPPPLSPLFPSPACLFCCCLPQRSKMKSLLKMAGALLHSGYKQL